MLKSKVYHNVLPLFVLAALSLWFSVPGVRAAAPLLPVLNWQQRSDWINVKTNVSPAAVGDGVHDDTAAIQAGLNLLDTGNFGARTLFLPAGTYRITKTLTLNGVSGALIVGTGRNTRLVWDGPVGGSMYISNGVSRSRYIGLTWDGAGKAGVGIDHQAHLFTETSILHQDEAFLNFTIAGIRAGYNYYLPTSEVSYRNCLFQNCASGAFFMAYNEYNNDFADCEFEDCGISINCNMGNVYVRDCHFERSTVTDLWLCSHSHSIRRCTSVGSHQFIVTPIGGASNLITVQDCHIDNWTSHTGAMQFGMRGPTTIFDCSFTNPPDAGSPVRLTNYTQCQALITTSNDMSSSPNGVVEVDNRGSLVDLPAGSRTASLSSASQSFFKSTETLPASVIDVKKDYGAYGDGYHDDTNAITRALYQGMIYGNNAVVYFPAGIYRVYRTLPLLNGNYTVEGSGYKTSIKWMGAHNSVVFFVQDPQKIALKNIAIDAPLDTAAIQQFCSGAMPTQMTYDNVFVGGSWLGVNSQGASNGTISLTRVNRGLECIGLPANATVHMGMFSGSEHFNDCGRATILADFITGGVMQVDGAQFDKSGFLGVQVHNDCGNPCDVVVRDNQDLVGANFYTEDTDSSLSVSGSNARYGQGGHVTIQGAKTGTFDPNFVTVNDYEGRVTYTSTFTVCPTTSEILQTGTRKTDIVLLSDNFQDSDPIFDTESGASLTLVQNLVSTGTTSTTHPLTNLLPGLNATQTRSLLFHTGAADAATSATASTATSDAVAALDDFRLLGQMDLAINQP